MRAGKRKSISFVIHSLPLLLVVAAVCFLQFNSCGYRITVPYRRAFEEIADHIYVNRQNTMDQAEIISLTARAKERVGNFFGDLKCLDNTMFIFCDDNALLTKLGGDHDTCTISFPFRKNCISISDEYCNIDILAHELTHAEFQSRLSVNASSKVPTWFDEGLATQNDYRDQYSPEAWAEQTNGGQNVIAPDDMDTPSEFYTGTADDRRFRYLNAKHEVSGWMEAHEQKGLLELIDRLNGGADFSTAYGGT